MILNKFQILFLITLFCVSFMSDLILNDLTRKPLLDYHNGIIIKSLKPYFKNKSLVQAGVYAGITVVLAYICLMIIWRTLGFESISTREHVYSKLNINFMKIILQELFFAFIIGFIFDVLIYKLNIFGDSLKEYYSLAGAGFWGATAFVFSILLSYFIIHIVYQLIK